MWGCSALPSPSRTVPGHCCSISSPPPPPAGLGAGFGAAPRGTRVGTGLSRSPCDLPPPGKLWVYFISAVPPGLLSPRRPGQPRQHRHAGCPGGFSHSCGRRRHGNELIAGEWRPPARPAGSGTRSAPGAFGGSPAVPSAAAQSPERAGLTLGTPRGRSPCAPCVPAPPRAALGAPPAR